METGIKRTDPASNRKDNTQVSGYHVKFKAKISKVFQMRLVHLISDELCSCKSTLLHNFEEGPVRIWLQPDKDWRTSNSKKIISESKFKLPADESKGSSQINNVQLYKLDYMIMPMWDWKTIKRKNRRRRFHLTFVFQ